MNFYFGKKNNEKNNVLIGNNEELDNKLDNIYESIQNIVFNKPENDKYNLKIKGKNKNDKNNLPNKALLIKDNDNFSGNTKTKENNYNGNINSNYITINRQPKEMVINNKKYKNNNYEINGEFNNINKFNFLNKTKNNNTINNNISLNKSILSQKNENNEYINDTNLSNKQSNKILDKANSIPVLLKQNKILKNENQIKFNKELINFYNSIKENSPNVFKANSSEKQLSQKEILRLKLEAFLVLKKYYLHRKSKSSWLKRKKKLIKISENFYRNILLSRAFYGFVLNSKRKSFYNLIKNNYIDFRIKELSSNFLHILKFCYNEKKLENKSFFELTKNKLRRVLNEMKSQMIYRRTMDKYLFTQIINNNTAVQFSKIIIYLGNKYNVKKLFRYEYNINLIINREEFCSKAKIFEFLRNQGNLIENELNKKVEIFKKNTIIFNDKKKFIMQLEEEIILSYKMKYYKQKIFFIRSKNYILSKKNWKKKSAIYGPNRDLILNFHNLKLKMYSFKLIKIMNRKKKQKIEKLQIKNFMKNVHFFFYQCRKKTIESLIIEGIRQKIKKYNKLLFMKIILYSKIECLKQYKVMITTRKKYQKRFLFNTLKRNVILNNKELLCNLKFFFNYCFKIKVQSIKEQKSINKLIYIQSMQKFILHQIQIKIELKKKFIKQKEEYKNNLMILRKRNFIKDIKKKINQKKYNNIIYLKHLKIFFHAIGIINLKHKCNVDNKLKKKIFIKKRTKYFFGLFKKKAIYDYKINNNKKAINKYFLKKNYITLTKNIKTNLLNNKKLISVCNIHKKMIRKKYLEAINVCFRMNNIYKSIYEYYITKRKKNFFNILKKRYQDSIKYSMLSIRFNEYLIISTFNCFLGVISKAQNNTFNNSNFININDN